MTDNKHNPEEESPLKKSYSTLKINLGLFAVYGLLFPLLGDGGMGLGSLCAYIHAIVLFFLGIGFLFVEGRSGTGAAMILSSLVLAVIGFSFCAGSINIH